MINKHNTTNFDKTCFTFDKYKPKKNGNLNKGNDSSPCYVFRSINYQLFICRRANLRNVEKKNKIKKKK